MDANERNMKTLELADRVRRFEIGLFWTRSLFFWGFTARLLRERFSPLPLTSLF